jgi:hypothetical protein
MTFHPCKLSSWKTDGSNTSKLRDFGIDLANGVNKGETDVPSIAMKSMAAFLCA